MGGGRSGSEGLGAEPEGLLVAQGGLSLPALDFPGFLLAGRPSPSDSAVSPPPVEQSSVGTGPEPKVTKGTCEMLSYPLAVC